MKKTQRQIQKELTRKNILKAAYKMFSKNGIMNTTTSDVADAAGVSHGTIFVHFKTQEELITAVIQDFGEKIGIRIHELVENSACIKDILKAHLNAIQEFEDFYTKLVIESRTIPNASRNVFVSIQSTLSFHLSKALEQQINAGNIINQPVYLLFNTWIGIVHYYLTNGDLFAPGESVIERYGDVLIDYYIKLISVKGRKNDK